MRVWGLLLEGFRVLGSGFRAVRVFRIEGAKAEEFGDLGLAGSCLGAAATYTIRTTHIPIL